MAGRPSVRPLLRFSRDFEYAATADARKGVRPVEAKLEPVYAGAMQLVVPATPLVARRAAGG